MLRDGADRGVRSQPVRFFFFFFIMGQTDSQFKAFIRFVLDALREVKQEKDPEKRDAKLEKILDNLQKTLED